MTRRRKIAGALLPWAGLIGAGAGWTLSHQIGSNTVFDDCRAGTDALLLLLGAFSLTCAAAGGLLSLRLRRRAAAASGRNESDTRRFLGLLGALLAALLALAILLQTGAALILPRCAA